MKTKPMTKRLLAVLLAIQGQAGWADSIRLDVNVTVKDTALGDKNGSAIQAFRSQTNCRAWYYLPGRHIIYGSVLHNTWYAPVTIGEQTLPGVVTALEMQTTPGIRQEHIDALKANIAQYLRESRDTCADPNVKPENIVLNPALVRARPATEKPSKKLFYASMSPTYVMDQAVYFDPTNPSSLTLSLDATNNESQKYIEQKFTASATSPVEFGRVNYMMEGILSSVHSVLSIKGEMDAEFDSAVKNTGCEVSSGSKNLNGFAAAVSMAGAAMGVGGIGYSESSTRCTYNLITEFIGGKYKNHVVFDHSRSKLDHDGRPIVIQVCDDKNKCGPVPLQSFIETQLFALMLMTNFDIMITKLSDETFKVSLGRKGTTKVTFEMTAEYLRSFHGTFGVSVPVFGVDLPKRDLDFSPLREPRIKCAQGKFAEQLAQYAGFASLTALPIFPACLGVN